MEGTWREQSVVKQFRCSSKKAASYKTNEKELLEEAKFL
jgi:hypothetical protein